MCHGKIWFTFSCKETVLLRCKYFHCRHVCVLALLNVLVLRVSSATLVAVPQGPRMVSSILPRAAFVNECRNCMSFAIVSLYTRKLLLNEE